MPQSNAAESLPEMTANPSDGVRLEKPAGPGHTGEWSQITAAQPAPENPSHGTIRIDLGQLTQTIQVVGVIVQKLGPTAALILASVYLLPPAFDRIHRGYAEIAEKNEKAMEKLAAQMDKQGAQAERAIDKLSTSLDKLADRMYRASSPSPTPNPKGSP